MKKIIGLCVFACVAIAAYGDNEWRTRYALNFGGDTEPIAQFVPGDSFIDDVVRGNTLYWYNDSETSKKFAKVQDDMVPYVDSGAKHTPIYYDIPNCSAAADGTMTLSSIRRCVRSQSSFVDLEKA